MVKKQGQLQRPVVRGPHWRSRCPPIWYDDPKLIKDFNASIGTQDDGIDYGREYALD
jgi:hypothetical protein